MLQEDIEKGDAYELLQSNNKELKDEGLVYLENECTYDSR